MNQEQRRIATKNKILKIAEKHFKEYEFDKIDINSICIEAGLTKGAFYHHFSSKQQLLLELLDNWINNIAGQLRSADFNSSDTISLLNIVVDRLQLSFEQAGNQLGVFLNLYIKAINDNHLRVYVLKSYKNFLAFCFLR